MAFLGRVSGFAIRQATRTFSPIRTVPQLLANGRLWFSPAELAFYGTGVLKPGEDPKKLGPSDWLNRLTPEQYYVCKEQGTEAPFHGKYVNHHEEGVYCCTCCGVALFSSETKFDSGSGWPSFWAAATEVSDMEGSTNVVQHSDYSLGMTRTEVTCKKCAAHLGHVFDDGPQPTGQRYCINSESLQFEPAKD